MDPQQLKELETMLAIIYKKLVDLERGDDDPQRSAELAPYLEELKLKAKYAMMYGW